MYWKVPRIAPCAVIAAGGVVGSIDSVPATTAGELLARPKSSSLAPTFVRKTLPGFRSRWTMPARCASIERAGDLHRDRQRLGERQRPAGDPIGQRLALEVLHDEERGSVVLADVVQRADVRVGELRDGARFQVEARAELRIGRQRLGQDFHRDEPIEPGVAGFVDLAHAAGAERAEDFVRSETRTCG